MVLCSIEETLDTSITNNQQIPEISSCSNSSLLVRVWNRYQANWLVIFAVYWDHVY